MTWEPLEPYVGGSAHDHAHGVHVVEARGRVAGLAWTDGRIMLAPWLEAQPVTAVEVFLAEAAHQVDFFAVTPDQRRHLFALFHAGDGTPHADHGWFEEAGSSDYWSWVGECVDEETTALSHRGWVGPDELEVGDEILTFDLETQTTRWAVVERVNIFDDAPYRVWSHRGIELAVTDNHRWVVRTRGPARGPYRLVPTTELRRGMEMPLAAPASDGPSTPKWDDDFVELMAWVLTEGYYKPNEAYLPPVTPGERRAGRKPGAGGVVITQGRYAGRVEALLRRLGVTTARMQLRRDQSFGNLDCYQWGFAGELARQIKDLAPGKAPTVGWLRSLTTRQLNLFIDVCIMGDGNESSQDRRQDRRAFIQNQGPRLDSFLAACALAGIPVGRANVKGECETWSIRRTTDSDIRNFVGGDQRRGRVWCPTTEVGTFVARRGRSVFITGNSWMAGFMVAYSDVVPSWGSMVHRVGPEARGPIRAILAPPVKAPYFGARRSKVFHDLHAGVRSEVEYQTRIEAVAAGRRPCTVCRP